jgi:hypothetical protein
MTAPTTRATPKIALDQRATSRHDNAPGVDRRHPRRSAVKGEAVVNREELVQLRDAIDMTLALPDSVRELLAQWLAPAAAKSNGHDLRPPVPQPPPKAAPTPRPAASKPHTAKRHDNPANARVAERRLLAAMRERPGLSSASLAKVVGAGLSTTKERLRRMGAQELIEKAPDGRRGAAPDCGERRAGPYGAPYDRVAGLEATPEPKLQPSAAHAPWVKPLSSYERRETTIVEGLR